MWSVESGSKIDEEVICVDLLFLCLFQDLAKRRDLVYGGIARSETTLIRTNQFVGFNLSQSTLDRNFPKSEEPYNNNNFGTNTRNRARPRTFSKPWSA